ncbi:MAG: PAS domain S-box protein [Desulfamplus sp.]|nr:PAS domain S-box protein [Desulfamplus sp.]
MIIVTKKRKKILWQIFPSFLIITLLSLTAVTWYSTIFFKSFFLYNTEKELTTIAEFVKREFISRYPDFAKTSSNMDIQAIDRLCKEIGQNIGIRVTIILPSGQVVGDSLGNIKTMENHKHRYEIELAINNKKGVSIRKSGTLGENMMYIAIPVIYNNDNEIAKDNLSSKENEALWIIRIAISITNIEKQIKSIQKKIFVALMLTVTAAAVVGLFVARRITRPIEEMRIGAQNFANGNLTALLPFPDSEELFQLALTMNLMAQTLNEKIRNLEDRGMELEAIYSSMKEGVIAVDSDENIITANNAAAAMFGYSSDKIKGCSIHELTRHYELQKFIKKALSNSNPVEDDIVISGDEDNIYNVHSTALSNSSRERLGTLIIFHDITRIRKLETMHKDFSANVSHELKTPLTSIKGFVETLENIIREQCSYENDDDNDLKNEQAIKFIQIIQRNVDRLIALINDLLALSRVEREEGSTIRLKPYDITQIIRSAIDACMPSSASKNITVEYVSKDNSTGVVFPKSHGDNLKEQENYECELEKNFTALIDPISMEQAIVNILDNAIKYSKSGDKVVITCEQEIQQNTQKNQIPGQNNQSIVISITDYGVGIGKEHLSRIFNRFYRVDKSRSRNIGGTGLGLAIVKHIVRYHRGDIFVISTPGKGSTFKIVLPSVF